MDRGNANATAFAAFADDRTTDTDPTDASQVDAGVTSHEHGDHARSVAKVMRAGVNGYASEGTWRELGSSTHRAYGEPGV